MNENLFASFITPTIIGLPIVILILIFLSMFSKHNQQINNCLISFQQWLVQLTSKQIINIHNHKRQKYEKYIQPRKLKSYKIKTIIL